MEWLINRRRMMCHQSVPPVYLAFEDAEFWRLTCINYGDYNETVITDNGDNTVNIVRRFKSVIVNSSQQSVTTKKLEVLETQTNVDNSEGTYTAGTTKEAVGITQKQCDAIIRLGYWYAGGGITNVYRGNSSIISANDFSKFRNMTEIYGNWNGNRYGGVFSCPNVASAEIPNTVETLGEGTFYGCNITYFDFKNVKSIGRAAFQATKLDEATFNEGFTTINGGGYGAFTDLSTVLHFDFPSTTTIINDAKLFRYGRPVVVCRGTTPPTLAAQSSGFSTTVDVYVPQAALETYQTTANWSSLAAYMRPLEGTWYEHHTKKPRGNYDKTFYDAEIEYLESTGTQYIDIRARLGTTARMVMKYSGFTDEYFACGARVSSNSNAFIFSNGGSNTTTYNKYYFNRRNQANSSTDCPNDENVHTVEMTKDVIIDGVTVCSMSEGSGNMTTPLFYLFARNNNGTIACGKMRIYSFQIYNGDDIYVDLIPVRIGQVGYMFDRASGRLLGNSGTGDFVLGNDKVS